MPDFSFLAALALLLAPGPTNTLLMVGAAARGLQASLPLLLGELFGYLVVVVPLATIAAPFMEDRPRLGIALRIAAACWILVLAIRLWRLAPGEGCHGQTSPVTIGQVFLTTVLNPKAPIVGLVLMPHGTPMQIAPAVGVFSLVVISAAITFLSLGSLIGRTAILPSRIVYRAAACFLVVFSLSLAGRASGLV